MANVVIAMLVVLLVMAVKYCWSDKTVQMTTEAIVLQYCGEVGFDDEEPLITTNIVRVRGAKHQDVDLIATERKSNHLFSFATGGEWGKCSRSHHSKGVTLHDYRAGNYLKKRVMHPCCTGSKSECFD